MTVSDFQLSQSFRTWRRVTRWALTAGVIALVGAAQVDDPSVRRLLIAVGLLFCVATFPLYFRRCNRCPRCRQSFSKSTEYASDDTSGLPLFGSIAACPFCRLDLDEERRPHERYLA